MFYLFVAILAVALLSAIGFVYFLILKKKYGKKPLLVSALVCVVLVGIAIPMGKQPSVSFKEYKEQSSVYSFESYLNDQVDVGTFVKITGVVITLDASIEGDENMFFLETETDQYYAKNNSGEEIRDGETITIFGKYAGKRNSVTPAISVQYFER